MIQERTSAASARKTAEPTPARLPLKAYYQVAGSIWLIQTNSPAILRAVEHTLEAIDGRGVTPDLSLHFAVDFDLLDKRPWPKPHFRGLNHLVYASYSSSNVML